jgi:hypothetical protein
MNGGDLAKSASTTVIIPFSVPDSYDTGVYSLQLVITYVGESGLSKFAIPITVSNPVLMQIQTTNISKQMLKPGEEFEISVSLNDTGGAAKDIIIVSPSNSSFRFSKASKQIISELQSDSSTELSMWMISEPSISAGTYTIPLEVSYTDRLGTTTTEKTEIGPVRIVDLETLFSITAEPIDEAVVGSAVRLNVTLTNNGQEDEQEVFIESPATDSIVMVGSTKISFGIVPANGQVSKIILLGIDPSANVGYYSVPLKVQLSTGQSFNTSIGMLVQAASQLSVTTETTPAVLIPGSDADLTVKISNVGDSSIRSMQVALSSDKMIISEGSETFLGTLNVDETSSAVAKVRAPVGPGGAENTVTATITFKDSNNQEHRVEKILVLGTASSALPGAIMNGSTSTAMQNGFRTNRTSTGLNILGVNVGNILPVLLGAIVLIIVAYFGYRWWKGKGGKKPDHGDKK